jgi:hypothetical protein
MYEYAMLWAAAQVVHHAMNYSCWSAYYCSVPPTAITWLHMQCIAQVCDKALAVQTAPYVNVYCCMLASMLHAGSTSTIGKTHHVHKTTSRFGYEIYEERYHTRRYCAAHVSTHCDSLLVHLLRSSCDVFVFWFHTLLVITVIHCNVYVLILTTLLLLLSNTTIYRCEMWNNKACHYLLLLLKILLNWLPQSSPHTRSMLYDVIWHDWLWQSIVFKVELNSTVTASDHMR